VLGFPFPLAGLGHWSGSARIPAGPLFLLRLLTTVARTFTRRSEGGPFIPFRQLCLASIEAIVLLDEVAFVSTLEHSV
jgi:hypothetical protein